MSDNRQDRRRAYQLKSMGDIGEAYEHVAYETGYYVAENGNILTLDGNPVPPERHISAEHLRMSAERKAKFQQG